MRKKFDGRLDGARDAGKRYGFCVLWMLALQFASCLACWGVLLLFGRDFELEWLVYTLGLLLPLLWGVAGYHFPHRFRIPGRWQSLIFWLVFLALPAALCWWAGQGGPDGLHLLCAPQLMARLAWFSPLFDGPASALVLNTLQPLAAAGMHLLLMAGFLLGMWFGRKRKTTVYT